VPADFEEVFKVSAPAGSGVRIINGDGKTVAPGHRGASQLVLTFRPRAFASSVEAIGARAPAAIELRASTRTALGEPAPDAMRYYLIVTPPPRETRRDTEPSSENDK
jgi:hypothetical protein